MNDEKCSNIDISPTIIDDLQPPVCKWGYEWSVDCLRINPCPGYCGLPAPYDELFREWLRN